LVSAKTRFGKLSSPGKEKLPAGVVEEKRLKPTRNSLEIFGEKTWK
jgi:hypothetical protein